MSIVIQSNPLWIGDGPRFLSALLDIPRHSKGTVERPAQLFCKAACRYCTLQKAQLLLGLFGLCSMAFVVIYCTIIISGAVLYLEKSFVALGSRYSS